MIHPNSCTQLDQRDICCWAETTQELNYFAAGEGFSRAPNRRLPSLSLSLTNMAPVGGTRKTKHLFKKPPVRRLFFAYGMFCFLFFPVLGRATSTWLRIAPSSPPPLRALQRRRREAALVLSSLPKRFSTTWDGGWGLRRQATEYDVPSCAMISPVTTRTGSSSREVRISWYQLFSGV